MSDLTHILTAIEQGNIQAADELLPAVYQELCVLAAQKLAREAPGQTLQPTALVHEAYLRLAGAGAETYKCRSHFFVAASEAMRRILIDNARRKQRPKRGGDQQRRTLDEQVVTLNAMLGLSTVYTSEGRYEDAAPLSVKVIEGQLHLRGEEHQDTQLIITELGKMYIDHGLHDAAEHLFIKTLERRQRLLGEKDSLTQASIADLCRLYEMSGQWGEAEDNPAPQNCTPGTCRRARTRAWQIRELL